MAQRVHYPALASFPDVGIAAICDLNPERLNATADQYGVEKRFSEYQQMIKTVASDGVYAVGPPHIMYDVWQWCLTNGQNLFIEKPMGITLHQAQALAYLADQHGCITQVGFQRRSTPMVAMLRDECLKRGPMTHAVCAFYKFNPEPYLNARDHMMDDGVHAIDTLRWMIGGEVVGIDSVTRRIGTPDINYFMAMLHFDNGATGLLLNNWTSGRRMFRVEMHAPGIFVEAEHEGMAVLYADGDLDGIRYDTRAVSGSDEFYVYGGFKAKNREFIDALKSHQQPPSHFGDAIKTMEIAEKILAQAILRGQ
jgi:predicted dehydrogenase